MSFQRIASSSGYTQNAGKVPVLLQIFPLRNVVATRLCSILDNSGLQTLGVLDVDGLHVGVELLLSALLVVTLTGDADAETEWDALDSGFPHLLVQLRVEADILGALKVRVSASAAVFI